jgi:hypothetical protein
MAKSSKNDINEIILSTVQDAVIDELKQYISECVKKYLTDGYKLIVDQAVRDVIEEIGIIPERKDKKKKSAGQPEVISDTLFEDVVSPVPTPVPAPELKAEDFDMSDILDSIDKEKAI